MAEKHKQEDWLVDQYIKQGKSMDRIAKEQKVNSGTVYYYIDKHDINTRDRIEAVKNACRVGYANYHMTSDGHMRWKTTVAENEEKAVYVARLLAVAEFGFEAVRDKEVHHKNGIPWDNRPGNVKPLSPGNHSRHHNKGRDHWEKKDTPWRDKEKLKQMYIGEKMACYEIADEFGVASSTVQEWLHKHDIDVRPAHIQRDEY